MPSGNAWAAIITIMSISHSILADTNGAMCDGEKSVNTCQELLSNLHNCRLGRTPLSTETKHMVANHDIALTILVSGILLSRGVLLCGLPIRRRASLPRKQTSTPPVPQSADEHGGEAVDICPSGAFAVSAQWYVDVIAKPPPKRYVPPVPEVGKIMCLVGKIEIGREFKAHYQRYADSHI